MRCRWCNEEIEFETSPIDDFWFHKETELMKCEGMPTIAEPPEGKS